MGGWSSNHGDLGFPILALKKWGFLRCQVGGNGPTKNHRIENLFGGPSQMKGSKKFLICWVFFSLRWDRSEVKKGRENPVKRDWWVQWFMKLVSFLLDSYIFGIHHHQIPASFGRICLLHVFLLHFLPCIHPSPNAQKFGVLNGLEFLLRWNPISLLQGGP